MKQIIFSQGGIDNSTGMRGGQISYKLCGQYEPLILNNQNVNIQNGIFIAIKLFYKEINILNHLKNNNNKIILDVIDLTDKNKFNPELNHSIPNFFPDIDTTLFDGYIVNNVNQKEWWENNIDNTKPIFVIPHHWDSRFEWFPKQNYTQSPYFYYLGTDKTEGYSHQNCLYLDKLFKEGLLYDWRSGVFPEQVKDYDFIKRKPLFYDSPINGCQINIRKTNSWEYCMKPSTKVAIAACMDSVIITTNDWSVQDILPDNYPYLLHSDDYKEVTSMIKKVKDTFEKEEWFFAKDILKEVKHKYSIDNIINKYYDLIQHFS